MQDILKVRVPKSVVSEMPNNLSFDEKLYKIVGDMDGLDAYEKWDIHDIKEEAEYFLVLLKLELDVPKAEEIIIDDKECCSDCSDCAECQEHKQEDSDPEMPLVYDKSVAYDGPWADKKFELDIAQAAAMFEVVQFCDYMIKISQMITPVAARSLQECQKYVLENFTDFDTEQMKDHQANPGKPLEIKINDDFAHHLKKWQEESVEIFEKIVKEAEKKPQIVTANMVPQAGFDPKGPTVQK